MARQPKRTFIVEGEEYPLPERFTLGEIADVEEALGGQPVDLERGGARATLALLYMAMKRRDPETTIDDVREIDAMEIDVQEEQPRPPAQAIPKTRKRKASATRASSGNQR